MKKIASIIFMAALWVACNQSPAPVSNGIVLDLNSVAAIDPKASISLADLGWSTEIIPLETSKEETLIQEINQMEESADFFWILADRKLLQFGKDGSFKRQIGQKGQGPEDYVGVHRFCLHPQNEEVYIMDYFGRKMCVFGWDGAFKYSFPLPEDYSFEGFYLSGDTTLYFYSIANAVMPDVLVYDPQTQQADTISYREREMGPEGFMGATTLYDLNGDTYVYHYFNDTVYTIQNSRLEPAWLMAASKVTYHFLELEFTDDSTPTQWPDGPRIAMDKIIETSQYIFAFYKLDENNALFKPGDTMEEKRKSLMAMYDKTKDTYYPHVNIVCGDQPWLSIENGKTLYYTPASNSLWIAKNAEEIIDYNVIKGLQYDDNPVLIRYFPSEK